MILKLEVDEYDLPFIERTESWIKRRRWLFQKPGTNNYKAPRPDRTGNHKRAVKIMRQNPTESVRDSPGS